MILAIDVGNTNIVLGCLDQEKTYFTARLSTDVKKTSDEYALMIRNLFHLHGIDRHSMDGAIISSVVPALSLPLQEAVRLVTSKLALLVGSGLKTGLNIQVDNPSAVGADLVVDAVAANACYPVKPIFILDMGTATTFTVVNQQGSYVGGMIIPGPVVALNALASAASLLGHVDLEAPPKLIGRNTMDSMRSGTVYGHAAMIDGLIDRAKDEMGVQEATVVATGGIAPLIIKQCKHKIILDDTLMLKGLLILYQKNSKPVK